jgi:patatin-like phospholipase/acyl hydrolase
MPGSDLRLLALDGGGVRGLSALMILEQLMEAVDPDAPPKPCDYFDMIGGTSTGGWVVTRLSRYKKIADDPTSA